MEIYVIVISREISFNRLLNHDIPFTLRKDRMIIASSLFLSRQNSLSHCIQIRAYQNASPSTRKSSASTAIYINVTLSYIIVHYHIIKWRRPRELSRSKNNNDKDICLLVDTRENVIILDATQMSISLRARFYFISLSTNLLISKKTPELLTPAARYTCCDSVILRSSSDRHTVYQRARSIYHRLQRIICVSRIIARARVRVM